MRRARCTVFYCHNAPHVLTAHPGMRSRLTALYCVFVISGFCGLVYESIWAKYLRLFLGAAAYAQAVVLIIFIGGLAAGAWLAGRRAERIRRPLRLYAAVEAAAGLSGLLFHPLFKAATAWGYDWLLPATCPPSGGCASAFLLAALLMLPQSILLGTTSPLMAAAVLRARGREPGREIAFLYFLNSIGAVAGVLAGTFVLLPWGGLPGTIMTAGVLNLAIALAAFKIDAASAPVKAQAERGWEALPARHGPFESWTLWVAALTGLSSFAYEVVWTRMLSLVLGSSVHAFELMLASFILGLALGGLWIRQRIDRLGDPRRFLAQVQIVMGLLAAGSLTYYSWAFDAVAWAMTSLPRDDGGYAVFNAGSALLAMGMMLPATVAAGMTLPLITSLAIHSPLGERGIGMVYAANTAGSIAGVVLAVQVALSTLGLRWGLVAAASIDILLGIWIFGRSVVAAPPAGGARRAVRRAATGWALAGVVGMCIAAAFPIDPLKAAAGVYRLGRYLDAGSRVAYHRDGKTATVDVVHYPDGVVSIRTNGKPDASIQMGRKPPPTLDEYTATLLGALPFVYRPDLKRAAVIGFGSGLTTTVLLDGPGIERVDTIEIEPAMVDGARAFLPRVERAFSDPRSHIVYDDARSYFARSRDTYDAIVSEPSNPWVSGVSSLFTAEFYAGVRRQLKPGGVFVQWLQCYEFDLALLADIVAALDSSFADYAIYATSGELVLVASPREALGEPSAGALRLGALAVDLRRIGLTRPSDVFALWSASRATADPYLRAAAAAKNSDFFPVVELRAPGRRFVGSRIADFEDLALAPVPLLRMLDRHAPPLVEAVSSPFSREMNILIAYRRAELSLNFFDTLAARDPRPNPGPLPAEMKALRAALVDCASPERTDALWDDVVTAAGRLNPFLPAERVDPLWAKLEGSGCLGSLPEIYRQWVALFRSVGNRDAPAMAREAEAMLTLAVTQRQFEYL